MDYLNEQSMSKIWVQSNLSSYQQLFNIKTVDIMDLITRSSKHIALKCAPLTSVIVDSRLEPQRQNYAILRKLLLDDMTITTVKQLRNDPRNVIFAIRQKREFHAPQHIS